jgi:stachyose synthetase
LLCGGCGGVHPNTLLLDARVMLARPSPGLASTMDDLAVDRVVKRVS